MPLISASAAGFTAVASVPPRCRSSSLSFAPRGDVAEIRIWLNLHHDE
jgi:hypothetical protein